MGNKYLKTKGFIEYAKSLNVETDGYDLEKYEENSFLFPIYRVILPIDYVERSTTAWHKDPVNYKVDKEYEDAEKVGNLCSFSCSYPRFNEIALKYGHPLDYYYAEKNKYIFIPSNMPFKPWVDYEFYDKDDHVHAGIKQTYAEGYYAEWQVFILYELNKYNTYVVNNLLKSSRGYGRVPYKSKFANLTEIISKVYDYDHIDDYLLFMALFVKPEEAIREKEYNVALKEVAIKLYKEHCETEWIKFIRELVQYYKEFRNDEKYKLADQLKKVLTKAIILIVTATGKTIEEISDLYEGGFKDSQWSSCIEKDGSLINVGALKEIYKKEYSHTRENILNILLNYSNSYAPLEKCDRKDLCSKLVDDVTLKGYEYYIVYLAEIRCLWNEKPLFWESEIWSHLRSFITVTEALSKEWFGEKHLYNNIQKAFGKEFDELVKSISNGKSITVAETLDEFKTNYYSIINYSAERLNNEKLLCNRNLVIMYLVRNYLSHNSKTENSQLRPEEFGTMFDSLIYSTLSLYCKYLYPKGNPLDIHSPVQSC